MTPRAGADVPEEDPSPSAAFADRGRASPEREWRAFPGAPFFVPLVASGQMFQRRTGPVSTWMKFDLRLYMPTPPR
jgi:hypothetical protein